MTAYREIIRVIARHSRCLLASARSLCIAVTLAMLATPTQAGVVFIPIIVPVPPPQVPAASTGAYDKIHTVAVLSAVGTKLSMRTVHFWSSKDGVLDINDWRIDDQVGATLRKYLSDRFVFRDVAFDRTALASIPNGQWNNSTAAVRKFLTGEPNDGIDAFLIVRPDLEYQSPGLEGIGLEVGQASPVVWANYEIDIIDAHSYHTIAKAYSRVQTREGVQPGFAGVYAGPDLQLDDSLKPNDQQCAELRNILSMLMPLSLVETVRALNLGVPLPPIGDHSIAPPPDIPDPYAVIKSVAVLSAIGDTFEFRHLGGTIMSQSDTSLPVADWGIDAKVEDEAHAILARKFTVKDVTVDRVQLAGAHLANSKGAFDPAFPGLSPTQDVDAYVVFVKVPLRLGWTVMEGKGIGLWNHTPLFGKNTAVFANYAIAFIDAHTLKLEFAYLASMSAKSVSASPYRKVDDAIWPDSPEKFTPENAATIRAVLDELLTDSIPETLYRMRLNEGAAPSTQAQTVTQ